MDFIAYLMILIDASIATDLIAIYQLLSGAQLTITFSLFKWQHASQKTLLHACMIKVKLAHLFDLATLRDLATFKFPRQLALQMILGKTVTLSSQAFFLRKTRLTHIRINNQMVWTEVTVTAMIITHAIQITESGATLVLGSTVHQLTELIYLLFPIALVMIM